MRQLNGVYTQALNRRHKRVGHLFQGRYKAILVDREAYLLEVSRYVELNPVRAGMVEHPGEWPWSSYQATVGTVKCPPWLETEWLLAQFGDRRTEARVRYAHFIAEGMGQERLCKDLKCQIYLGDERFVAQMQARLRGDSEDVNIPRVQRRPPAPALAVIKAEYTDRNAAMVAAYQTGEYSYHRIAEHFGVHFTTVGRIMRAAKKAKAGMAHSSP
jgi:putative transposase